MRGRNEAPPLRAASHRRWRGWRTATACLLALAGTVACGGAPAANAPAAAGGGTPGAHRQASPTPVRITVPQPNTFPYIYVYVMRDLGPCKQYSLACSIEAVQPPADDAALTKGEIEFTGTTEPAVRAAEHGEPIRIVFSAAVHSDFVIVGSRGLTKPPQLAGKKIASTTAGGLGPLLLTAYMKRQGIARNRYEVAPMVPPAEAAALTSGQVQAAIMIYATAAPLLARGYPLIARMSDYFSGAVTGLATSLTEIRQHPAVVRSTLSAALAAMRYMKAHPQQVVAYAASHFHMQPAVARNNYNLDVQHLWTFDGRLTQAQVQSEFSLDMAGGYVKHAPAASSVFDWSLLPAAGASASGA